MDADQRRTFQRLTTHLDPQMLIVTAAVGEERAGCLVGFNTQASIDPPRYVVLLSDKNRTYRVARRATALGVHVLSRRHLEVAAFFGHETGDELDKFAHWRWTTGPDGVPILDVCGEWFVGRVLDQQRLGDHVAFLLEPTAASCRNDIDPLGLRDVIDLEPGHAP